jgi:hypothetical protein
MVYLCLMDRCKAQKSLVVVGGFRIRKKKTCPNGTGLWLSNGDPPGTRTRDTLIKSQVLYQLS